MRFGVLVITFVALFQCGCTNRQLARSMVSQASTVMDIEYQMVLDNIAMFECNPSALPWHVRINDGVVQVNDQGGLAGLGVQWGSSPNFTRGPEASRSVTEQWGADAITNPRIVKKLQDVYREAIGMPPEPDPIFFQWRPRAQSASDAPTELEYSKTDMSGDREELPPGKVPSDHISRHSADQSATASTSDRDVNPPINWPDFEIPTGWFHVGHKCDVPHNACYVGSHCDCYVWVTHEGMSDLSRFSLTILAITNSQTKELIGRQLTYTR